MKLLFAGTPDFAAASLAALLAAGHTVLAVLTQPDRPAGRGMKLQPSPVKALALQHGLPVLQPTSLKTPDIQAELAAYGADMMVVAAYGLLLPPAVLALPRWGCVNVHASLLPRWRGAAPIHRAIEAGDAETGITLMQMDAGLDTGDMLAVKRIAVDRHTQVTLHDELATMGAAMTVDYLKALQSGNPPAPIKQPAEGVTYADKISKDEARLNWAQPATILEQKIRAFNPSPATYALIDAENGFKVYAAEVVNDMAHEHVKGEVLKVDKSGIEVACGRGILRILEAQRAGGKRLPVAQFIEGFVLTAGQVLQ